MATRQRLRQALARRAHSMERDSSHTRDSVHRHALATSPNGILDLTGYFAGPCLKGPLCPCGKPENRLNEFLRKSGQVIRPDGAPLKATTLRSVTLTFAGRKSSFELWVIGQEMFAVDTNDAGFVGRIWVGCLLDEQERKEKQEC